MGPGSGFREWMQAAGTSWERWHAPGALVLIVAIFLMAVGRIVKAVRAEVTARKWAAIARRRAALRERQVREMLRDVSVTPPLTAAEEQAIYNLTAGEIAEGVTSGKLSAARVLAVFAQRTHVFGLADGLNAVTEPMYGAAMARARAIDDAAAGSGGDADGGGSTSGGGTRRLRRRSKQPPTAAPAAPPRRRVLEGVPISIKEIIDMEGTDSTCGIAARCFQPAAEDALVVRLLKEAGALPFCKTNVPQSLISFETVNNIFGRTLSPWDRERTPGGSSGGESALLASRGAPLSLGTDIGGSVRIPCGFAGLYGIKPTADRMSNKGLGVPRRNNKSGQTVVRAVAGPMGTCVNDLSLVCEAWWGDGGMWREDPYVYPKLFDRETYERGKGRPLRVGLVTSDRYFQPCASVTRALEEAAEALRQRGHEVVPLELPYNGWEIIQATYRLMGADGDLHFMREALEGEPLVYIYEELNTLAGIPNWLRAGLCWLASLLGERRLVNTGRTVRTGGANTREYWQICILIDQMQQAFLEHLRGHGLDALLTPISPLPAFRHDHSPRLMIASSYSFLPNLLRWPSGVVPVTQVRPDEQTYDLDALPPDQRDSLSRRGRRQVEGSAGLPVGVQVMTCFGEDELCLHVMREIERQIPFRRVPPEFDGPVVGGGPVVWGGAAPAPERDGAGSEDGSGRPRGRRGGAAVDE